jgi:hypothetical protein
VAGLAVVTASASTLSQAGFQRPDKTLDIHIVAKAHSFRFPCCTVLLNASLLTSPYLLRPLQRDMVSLVFGRGNVCGRVLIQCFLGHLYLTQI